MRGGNPGECGSMVAGQDGRAALGSHQKSLSLWYPSKLSFYDGFGILS